MIEHDNDYCFIQRIDNKAQFTDFSTGKDKWQKHHFSLTHEVMFRAVQHDHIWTLIVALCSIIHVNSNDNKLLFVVLR